MDLHCVFQLEWDSATDQIYNLFRVPLSSNKPSKILNKGTVLKSFFCFEKCSNCLELFFNVKVNYFQSLNVGTILILLRHSFHISSDYWIIICLLLILWMWMLRVFFLLYQKFKFSGDIQLPDDRNTIKITFSLDK